MFLFLDLTVNGPLAVENINGFSMSELMKNPFKDGSYQENLTVEVRRSISESILGTQTFSIYSRTRNSNYF